MAYKTILTYWDSEPSAEQRTALAAALTRRYDGHLSVLSFGFEPDIPPYAFGGVTAAAMSEFYGEAQAEATRLAEAATAAVGRHGVNGESRAVVCTHSGLAQTLGEIARYADLVVLSAPSASASEHAMFALLEGTLFDGDAPALVCPAGTSEITPRKVVIGWNHSREALRAVRRAMPFLLDADRVEILVIDPSDATQTPGEGLALMLARHGVKAEITLLPSHALTVSKALCQHVQDIGADLLVAGAYSHSRFREYLLGGVTRDVLAAVPVPVLLAH